jgi:energy-converting hydrogenase Eha subunit C
LGLPVLLSGCLLVAVVSHYFEITVIGYICSPVLAVFMLLD